MWMFACISNCWEAAMLSCDVSARREKNSSKGVPTHKTIWRLCKTNRNLAENFMTMAHGMGRPVHQICNELHEWACGWLMYQHQKLGNCHFNKSAPWWTIHLAYHIVSNKQIHLSNQMNVQQWVNCMVVWPQHDRVKGKRCDLSNTHTHKRFDFKHNKVAFHMSCTFGYQSEECSHEWVIDVSTKTLR